MSNQTHARTREDVFAFVDMSVPAYMKRRTSGPEEVDRLMQHLMWSVLFLQSCSRVLTARL